MTTSLAVLLIIAPFALAAVLTWLAWRSGHLRLHLDQFRVSAPMMGGVADHWTGDRDALRTAHDLAAIRSRFEAHPAWPASGALGERR